jgi:hypothetical protein
VLLRRGSEPSPLPIPDAAALAAVNLAAVATLDGQLAGLPTTDEVVAAAMIDRLVHHAEVVSLRGDSYRLKDRDLGRTSTAGNEDQ